MYVVILNCQIVYRLNVKSNLLHDDEVNYNVAGDEVKGRSVRVETDHQLEIMNTYKDKHTHTQD